MKSPLRLLLLAWFGICLAAIHGQSYPFWQDQHSPLATAAVPNLQTEQDTTPKQDAVTTYLQARATQNCAEPQSCVGFYSQHLESAEASIAQDAFVTLASLPLDVLQANIKGFNLSRLRRHIGNRKVDMRRRDFYAFLLGMQQQYADRRLIAALIDEFLIAKKHRQTPMVGMLVGYGYSGSNFAHPMFLKVLRARPRSTVHAESVLRAANFLHQHGPEKLKSWLPKVLSRTLDWQPQLQGDAIQLARSWREATLSQRLVELYRGDATELEIRREIELYCEAIANEPCRKLLAEIQPPLQESSELDESIPSPEPAAAQP